MIDSPRDVPFYCRLVTTKTQICRHESFRLLEELSLSLTTIRSQINDGSAFPGVTCGTSNQILILLWSGSKFRSVLGTLLNEHFV